MPKDRIPEEIRRHRPGPCTEIKPINHHYYVYTYAACRLPGGRWGKRNGKCIGKIVEGVGFIPNKNYNQGVQDAGEDAITVLEYGQYALIHSLGGGVLERLRRHFPAGAAARIFSVAAILYANDFVHMDQIRMYYEQSWLSLEFGSLALRLGRTAAGGLLDDLGRRTARVVGYEREMIEASSGGLAIDGHAIGSCSGENDLAETGSRFRALNEDQVNLLMGYDVNTGTPLFARMYRGTCNDKSTIEDLDSLLQFRGVLFVVDRGFYSKGNLSLLSANGNTYIIPVPAGTRLHRECMAEEGYTESFYRRSGAGRSRIECRRRTLETREGGHTTVYVFRDVEENERCRYNYLHCMDLGRSGYTREKFEAAKDFFGVYVLQTNGELGAQETFEHYKKRWGIETFYQYVANVGDYKNLMMQDYYKEQGLAFILLVAGQIHQAVLAATRKLGDSTVSTRDLLLMARRMKLERRGDFWLLKNTRRKDLEILKRIDFVPRDAIPADETDRYPYKPE
ncbi:MAG: transposase [Oligosphaeraceae bacterium]